MTRRDDSYDSFFPTKGRIKEYRAIIESETRRFCRNRKRNFREVLNDAIILADRADKTYDPSKGDFEPHLLYWLKGLGRATQYLQLDGKADDLERAFYGGNTVEEPTESKTDARSFIPQKTVKGWWDEDESISRVFKYSDGSTLQLNAKPFDRGETWEDFSRRKRLSYRRQIMEKAAPDIQDHVKAGDYNPDAIRAIVAKAHGNGKINVDLNYREPRRRRISQGAEEKLRAAVKDARPTLTVIENGVLNWWLGSLIGTDKRTLEQLAEDLNLSGKGQASKLCKRVKRAVSEYAKKIS